MAHRCEHLCSASQLWLPHPALCVVPPECFWGLCIWSGAVGSKSGKLRNIADRDTTAQYMPDFPCVSHSYWQVQQDCTCFKPSRAGITHYPLIGLWVTSDPPDFRHFLSIFYGFPSTFHQYVNFHTHMHLFGHHHPPLSIWAIFFVIWPQCHRLSAICSPNNSAFSPTSSNFRVFAHACACFGSSSTHPGLPSPSSNWPHIPPSVRPPIPPTCWPSATFCPTPHRFLSISHPIRPSIRLFVCQPTHFSIPIHLAPTPYPSVWVSMPIRLSVRPSDTSAHLSTNSVQTPSVRPTQVHPHPPVWAWSPLTHLSVQALCLPLSVCCHHRVTFTSVTYIVDIF